MGPPNKPTCLLGVLRRTNGDSKLSLRFPATQLTRVCPAISYRNRGHFS